MGRADAGCALLNGGCKSDAVCKECVAGRYVATTGSAAWGDCILCGPGKYVDTPGSDEASDCIACPAGQHGNSTRSTDCSALSCDELGTLYGGDWRTTTGSFQRGSDQVCSESEISSNGGEHRCFGGQVPNVGENAPTTIPIDGWADAATICTGIGSRLCTVAELQAEESLGSGCWHDQEWVWAADTCDGGHMTAVGNSIYGPQRCADTGEGTVVHATGHSWSVIEEPRARCLARLAGLGLPVVAVRRPRHAQRPQRPRRPRRPSLDPAATSR